MRFIGDVHGKFNRCRDIIRDCPASIQVGDMGVGFGLILGDELKPMANPPFNSMSKGNHRFIRGNHDNPEVCKRHKFWIPDGTVENDMMFIGGADSIDKGFRIEGVSWWRDEQLSQKEFEKIIDVYLTVKPRIMVTHDCPQYIAANFLYNHDPEMLEKTTTRNALHAMWFLHKPEIWVFGHWHKSFDQVINGTRFICLAELEYKDIE